MSLSMNIRWRSFFFTQLLTCLGSGTRETDQILGTTPRHKGFGGNTQNISLYWIHLSSDRWNLCSLIIAAAATSSVATFAIQSMLGNAWTIKVASKACILYVISITSKSHKLKLLTQVTISSSVKN